MTSLATAWHIQKPVARLARAAHAFRKSEQLFLRSHGPSEIKKLIRGFNEMAHELSEADQERALMLAGIAHDLRAPLTRMKLRASFVADEELRMGLMQDATSLSQIITQFLDFARDTEPDASAPRIAVDTFCRSYYAEANDADGCPETSEPPVRLYLGAGPNFTLPKIELDRMLSNLVENAFTYGAPSLHIETSKDDNHYRLTVRNHGGHTGRRHGACHPAICPVKPDARRGCALWPRPLDRPAFGAPAWGTMSISRMQAAAACRYS
jgi:two-component system osmolarity sensor histidine kinase EnvZ